MPSLACAAATCAGLAECNVAVDAGACEALAQASRTASEDHPCIDLASTFYLINPSGDLPSTQATFQEWFQQQAGWQVQATILCFANFSPLNAEI